VIKWFETLAPIALPALFAGFVAILSTIAVERLGGTLGGVLSCVPTTIIAAAIGIYGRGEDIDGFRRSMAFIPVGILMNAGYLLLWRIAPAKLGRGARTHLLAATVAIALGLWLLVASAIVTLNTLLKPTLTQSIAVGLIAFTAGTFLGFAANRVAHPAPRGRNRVSVAVLALRGSAAAMVIAVALVLARTGLPVASGIASVFPVIFTTSMVATWLSQGPHVPTGAVGPMVLGTLSVSAYALLAMWLFPLMPLALAAIVSWFAAIGLVSVPAYLYLKARRHHANVCAGKPENTVSPSASISNHR
jgi:uncharacterized membrane protein